MDISWIYSKLGMFLGFMVILGVMFKVAEVYDVNAARDECNDLAKKIGDSMGRAATIPPQLIQAQGGVYRTKLDLPGKLHGAFYSLKLDFSGAVVIEYPQGYRGRRFTCIGIIPSGAIPDPSAGEYLGVNNAYMIAGNTTPNNYGDDVYVWPRPAPGVEVQTPPSYVLEEPIKEFRIEFVTQSDWVAFKLESSSDDELLSPASMGVSKDGTTWDYVNTMYSYPPCQTETRTTSITVRVKDNDNAVTIRTGEGAGCSKNKAGDDTVKVYFNNYIQEEQLLESGAKIGCKSGYESCTGFKTHTVGPLTYLIQPFNHELKSLRYIEVNKTRKGMVVTLGGLT